MVYGAEVSIYGVWCASINFAVYGVRVLVEESLYCGKSEERGVYKIMIFSWKSVKNKSWLKFILTKKTIEKK